MQRVRFWTLFFDFSFQMYSFPFYCLLPHSSGVVEYNNVVNVMKNNYASLPNSSSVNYGEAGIKISNTRHTEDRVVLSSLGAARIEKGIRVTQRSPKYQQSRRLDAWGKPLNLPPSERTYVWEFWVVAVWMWMWMWSC